MRQTLTDRIADKTLLPLAPVFVSELRAIAKRNNKHEDEIWSLWQKYSGACSLADQSALISEFCQWNKLHD